MAEPKKDPKIKLSEGDVVQIDGLENPKKYPYTDEDKRRLQDYGFFRQMFEGAHFEAFKQRVGSKDFNEAYAKLRYVYINFAGMMSRIVADMLFGEPIAPKVDNADLQEWIDEFWRENAMDVLCYESALTNSSQGDEVFKVRTGIRRPGEKEITVILESVPPQVYFPRVDGFNVAAEPEVKEIAWVFESGGDKYLRREIHKPGMIFNKVHEMKGDEVGAEVSLDILGINGLVNQQATKIERHMVIHVPNWKTSDRWNGYSDYYDLDAIFFAINNRMTKIDNVLDKHTDPILMVPPGVIDDKTGKVKKDGRVIEMESGEDGKPEYVVWDASLENAFKQLEKLIESMYMIGEISPDVLGMGQGQSDSGRALKYKLMRTIAKVSRKKLYYDRAIKEALYVAQLTAKAWGAKVNGKPFPNVEPERPELVWQDGIPVDQSEQIENEQKAIDAKLTTTKEAIKRVYQVDDEAAEKMKKEIDKETELKMPMPLDPKRNPFSKDEPPADPKAKPPQPQK